MASSKLSVLREAGRLLRFRYDVENEISETGKRLENYLQQAVDEVMHETDWVFGVKLIELAPDAALEGQQYGFRHTFKLPNDCVRDIGLFPYYMKQGESGYVTPINMFIVGLPYNSFGVGYKLFPLKFKRISNMILSDVDKVLLEYISNDIECIDHANEIWFPNLIAHKLAVLAGATILSTSDYQQLKQEYAQIILPRALNKNCNLKDKVYNYSDSGIYPYTQGAGTYY